MQQTGPIVVDAEALKIFQSQWDVYRKFLDNDYLSNRQACAVFRQFLTDEVARPFRILDLACGDASGIVGALRQTGVAEYRGVDLSAPALRLAAESLADLDCPVTLIESDFTKAPSQDNGGEDIVWISLSLHHLVMDDKRAFMSNVRASLKPGGAFLIYEPTRHDGEDRDDYLERFEEIGRANWTELSQAEFDEAMKHVRTCDLPETVSDWRRLGSESGFAAVQELYCSPTDLFRLFLYRR